MSNQFDVVPKTLAVSLGLTFFTAILPAHAQNEATTVNAGGSSKTARFRGGVELNEGTSPSPPLDGGNQVVVSSTTDSMRTDGMPMHKPLKLWVTMTSSDGAGANNVFQPTYMPNTGVTQKDYDSLKDSPLVQARIDEWKSWYARLYETLRPNSQTRIPASVRAKVNISVSKNGKVTAFLEWMDQTSDPQAKQCIQWFINRAQTLTPDIAQFPHNSYIDLLRLNVEFNGRENRYALSNLQNSGWQALDYDHD